MGLFRGVAKVGSFVFNFRVDKWLDLPLLINHTRFYVRQLKSLYQIERISEIEDFEEAYVRLQWTPELLAKQINRFLGFFYFFIALSICFFIYAFIIFKYGNFMGACMSTAVGVYSSSVAFRFHFWRYELKHRKLGCSLKEWFRDFYRGSH